MASLRLAPAPALVGGAAALPVCTALRPSGVRTRRSTRRLLVLGAASQPGPRGEPGPAAEDAKPASKCPFPRQLFQQEKERGPLPASASASVASASSVQEVPGSWDNPGALRDSLDYWYLQGWHKFVTSRMEKYKSTIFKTHLGPDLNNSKVVYIVDRAAYDIFYDSSKVDKKDIFFGLYKPDLETYFNGYRILSLTDPTEEKHQQLKGYCIKLLVTYGPKHIPAAEQLTHFFFDKWEQAIAKDGKVEAFNALGEYMWNWHLMAFNSKKAWQPGNPEIVSADFIPPWVGPMVSPTISLPGNPVKEFVIKTFILPIVSKLGLAKPSPHDALDAQLKFYAENMDEAVTMGMQEPFNLTREEALVNLQFFISFNSRGAVQGAFADTLMQLGVIPDGVRRDLMKDLNEEAQAAVTKTGGKLTMESVANMPLLESTVYEVLRLHPRVFHQHARMREDHIINTHTASYQLHKGDVICGDCYFVSRDPKTFPNPDAFDPRRFLGPNKSSLMRNLLWSNGYQSHSVADTISSKQCPGKDLVPLLMKVFLAHFVLRYSYMELTGPTGWNLEKMPLGSCMQEYAGKGEQHLFIKSLTPAPPAKSGSALSKSPVSATV